MAKRKLNVRLLRRIQKYIMAEPRRLDMGNWVEKFDQASVKRDDALPPCGTTACIAGTAALLSGKRGPQQEHDNLSRWHDQWVELGAKLIGVPIGTSDDHFLFHVDAWPETFMDDYYAAGDAAGRAKVACARIDHLIKTGE